MARSCSATASTRARFPAVCCADRSTAGAGVRRPHRRRKTDRREFEGGHRGPLRRSSLGEADRDAVAAGLGVGRDEAAIDDHQYEDAGARRIVRRAIVAPQIGPALRRALALSARWAHGEHARLDEPGRRRALLRGWADGRHRPDSNVHIRGLVPCIGGTVRELERRGKWAPVPRLHTFSYLSRRTLSMLCPSILMSRVGPSRRGEWRSPSLYRWAIPGSSV